MTFNASRIAVSVFVLLLSTNLFYFVNKLSHFNYELEDDQYAENVSSVWCQNEDGGNKLCTFKNLCYLPRVRQFIFVLSSGSVISGISGAKIWTFLELSSVQDHNNLNIKLAVVNEKHEVLKLPITKRKFVILLHRFKPDNIMHVIHDDLMPLFFTYMFICSGNIEKCISTYNVVFTDEGESGPYSEWYSLFSNGTPLHLHKEDRERLVCFEECRTGIVQDSVWYQYGFGKPQGPVSNTKLTGEMVKLFSSFIKNKFLGSIERSSQYTATLFSRKINRKILNEHFVIQSVKAAVEDNFSVNIGVNVLSVDLSVNSTRAIMSLIAKSKLLLGVHGSAMIFSMFLEPRSVVVEIFPYAINASHVSAVKRLCALESLGLVYTSWTNMVESNSVAHPEAPPLLGGITHLPLDQQQQIKDIYPIPAVHCCHDPAYLYRMFQDTIVGEGFVKVLHNALKEIQIMSMAQREHVEFGKRWKKLYFPSDVTDVGCYTGTDKTVKFNWSQPINICNEDDVQYKVAIVGGEVTLLNLTLSQPSFSLVLSSHVGGDVHFNIWIKTEVNGTEGADVYSECHVYV